jgi:hypothetical protein
MDARLKMYLSEIGRKGGQRSRRVLSSEEARLMVRIREARRLYSAFHDQCFWNAPRDLRVGREDIDWVARKLRENGGRAGWEAADKLCR